MEIALSIIGAFASLYGAYLAIQAKKEAKTSAELAEGYKNQVVKKQKTTTLAIVLTEAKRIQKVFGKYTIAPTNKSLSGVNFQTDSESLQSFIFSFNDNRSLIDQLSDIDSEKVYKSLIDLQSKFTQSSATKDKILFGKQIRLEIDSAIFSMRKGIDDSNEE